MVDKVAEGAPLGGVFLGGADHIFPLERVRTCLGKTPLAEGVVRYPSHRLSRRLVQREFAVSGRSVHAVSLSQGRKLELLSPLSYHASGHEFRKDDHVAVAHQMVGKSAVGLADDGFGAIVQPIDPLLQARFPVHFTLLSLAFVFLSFAPPLSPERPRAVPGRSRVFPMLEQRDVVVDVGQLVHQVRIHIVESSLVGVKAGPGDSTTGIQGAHVASRNISIKKGPKAPYPGFRSLRRFCALSENLLQNLASEGRAFVLGVVVHDEVPLRGERVVADGKSPSILHIFRFVLSAEQMMTPVLCGNVEHFPSGISTNWAQEADQTVSDVQAPVSVLRNKVVLRIHDNFSGLLVHTHAAC